MLTARHFVPESEAKLGANNQIFDLKNTHAANWEGGQRKLHNVAGSEKSSAG